MELTLYYAPIACSIAPYITLTEAGAAFDVKPVNIFKGEQLTPEFLSVNPKHKVPAMVCDGKVLTENVAIHTWVAQTFPKANILPVDEWQRLQAQSVLAWCSAGIHPFLTRMNKPERVCDTPGSEQRVRQLATEALFENYAIADSMLADREYFFEHLTAADAHFFWAFRRGGLFKLDLSKFPHCVAHLERMQRRESVKKALAYEQEVLDAFGMTL